MLNVQDMNSTVGDFQREYLFKVAIIAYPAHVGTTFSGAADFAKNVDLYTEKFKLPESKTAALKIKWAGMWAWFSGIQDPAGYVLLSLRCDRQYKSLDFFEAWKAGSGTNEDGSAQPKSANLGQFEVYMVDVDKTTILKTFVLDQVQIFEVQEVDIDKGGENETKINVLVHYETKRIKAGKGSV